MKSEKEKMLAGETYNPMDRRLRAERESVRVLLREFNDLPENKLKEIKGLIKKIIPASGANLWIQRPFFCDYGSNIVIGDRVFFNFNCTILDVCMVKIGHRCMFGPNVQVYAATHPMDFTARASGEESGKPVTIGDDVWIGGAVVICPGVTIGDRSVIGAGSVVTRDVPADSFAAGNPCRVIKRLSKSE
jgi:maltose O-acetyltransferase